MNERIVEVPGIIGQCPICNHAPIRHEPDGMGGATCLVCWYLSTQAQLRGTTYKVCTLRFHFKLSQRDREQAMKADPATYPPRTICKDCYCEWEAHAGFLCPSGDSTFEPLLDKDLPFIYTK